ncbi:MAG TPA: hypothetical protein VF648_05890 [Pyrinomonadaceae bacterium]
MNKQQDKSSSNFKRLRIAHHVSGYAVMSTLLGHQIGLVSIEPDVQLGNLGFISRGDRKFIFKDGQVPQHKKRALAEFNVLVSLAGPIAEARYITSNQSGVLNLNILDYLFKKGSGSAKGWAYAFLDELAKENFLSLEEQEELNKSKTCLLNVADITPHSLQNRFERITQVYMDLLTERCHQIFSLKPVWGALKNTVQALIEKETLNGAEVSGICLDYEDFPRIQEKVQQFHFQSCFYSTIFDLT